MNLTIFVITHGTKDYGDKFVVREHRGRFANAVPLAVCGSLEEARGAIEEARSSLVQVDRKPWDDKVIVESWCTRDDARLLEAFNAYLHGSEA